MSLIKIIFRIAVFAAMLLGGNVAMAGPVRCSVNNQDSTCVGHLTTAWQTPPTCPASAGWTTVTPAKWIGSQYSAPNCNYQAQPTCPSGYDQSPPATWNGSNWVGLNCTPHAQPPLDPRSVCLDPSMTQGLTPGGATQVINEQHHLGTSYYTFFPMYGVYYDEAGYSGNEWIFNCNINDATGQVSYHWILDYSSYFQTIGGGGG